MWNLKLARCPVDSCAPAHLKLAPFPSCSLLPSQFYLDHKVAAATLCQLPWLRCLLPARLKLVRFPAHSPLPTAALPSMSLSQKLHSLDRDVFYVAFPTRSIRALGLPIYLARVPVAPFARSYPRHFTLITRSPRRPCASYLAALPSTRRDPDRDVFYVADPFPRERLRLVDWNCASVSSEILT